jgi:tol-pal system protein YbgF
VVVRSLRRAFWSARSSGASRGGTPSIPARNLWMCLALAGSLSLPGCWGARWARAPGNTEKTLEDVQLLKQRQEEILERIDELEKLISDQEQYLRSSTADSKATLDEMLAELQYLRGQVTESGDRMGALTRRVESVTWKMVPPDTLSGQEAVQGTEARGPSPDEVYDAAYLDVTRGNYSLAIDGFEEYLRNFPDTDLADNAQYWIGECYYAQRDYFKAIEEFGKVLDLYPRGDKVPAAMVKLGISYIEVRDRASAKKMLNQVVDLYPHTDEAALARERLATLE